MSINVSLITLEDEIILLHIEALDVSVISGKNGSLSHNFFVVKNL